MTEIRPFSQVQLRPYQDAVINAIENDGIKRALLCWPRRSGKDFIGFYIMVRAALEITGLYYYCLPTYSQARSVIWDAIMNDSRTFLSFIPEELIARKNDHEMKLVLHNGSIIKLIGSSNYDTSLVGSNPRMIVFSEYSLSDKRAYEFARPILLANGGKCLILSTPRGKNHFYEMYERSCKSDEWFVQKLTIEDTKHITQEQIDKDIEEGEMSWDLAQQEYFTSFSMGVEGAFYTKYLDEMKLQSRIGNIPWDPSYKVSTAWDLGVKDHMAIVFFQVKNGAIYVINTIEHSEVGLTYYINELSKLPYQYGVHLAPHDIQVRDLTSGTSRIEIARELGINFEMVARTTLYDGIEAVRVVLPKTYIDQKNGAGLVKALENYRKIFDHKTGTYREHPLKSKWNHMADAFRYLAVGYKKASNSASSEEWDDAYKASRQRSGQPNFMSRESGWY